MKSLWAPWRMDFISSFHNGNKPQGCLFCSLKTQKKSSENLLLHSGKKAIVLLNKYPFTNGHLMVVPKRHEANFTKLTKSEHDEINQLISRSIKALEKLSHPQGFNVGLNLGRAAGAGIEEHLHYHIVPRWMGDSNFMPVIGGYRVIPEFIHQTYDKLIKIF